MYDVIKDILSKRRVVYYKSMRDFLIDIAQIRTDLLKY